jgi:peptidoglycan/xylan/chitin deacetylase (PgdA/CDA1 family)
MKPQVPVLITCDIDPTPESNLKDKQKAIRETLNLFNNQGIKATFFIVGNLVKDYQNECSDIHRQGHEIGCHGLTHDEREEYTQLSEDQVRSHLTKATDLIKEQTGLLPRSFRGPRVKTSHVTQKVLEELGYHADSSVCSQRIDFISSNLINPHWILAPRKPYHPSRQNAFKRGNRSIWVIPVSALILPFISGSLYIFGLTFMKRFFRLLYHEALKTGKPIVYLMHPAEFSPHSVQMKYKTSIKEIRARGFYLRRRLKLSRSIEERYQRHEELFSYMKTFPNVSFITVDAFCRKLERK